MFDFMVRFMSVNLQVEGSWQKKSRLATRQRVRKFENLLFLYVDNLMIYNLYDFVLCFRNLLERCQKKLHPCLKSNNFEIETEICIW